MNVTCKRPDAFLPVITSERISVGSVGSSATETHYGEITFRKDTIASGYDNYAITVSSPGFETDYTLTNETPEICTLADGVLTRVANGTGILTLTQRGWSRKKTFSFTSGSSYSYVWTEFDYNNTCSVMCSNLRSMAQAGGDLCYFSNYTQGDTTVTRNPARWFTPDLSGSAIATDIFGGWSTANSGALITPRHYVGVYHWLNGGTGNMGVGKRVMFAEADGTTHTRTVLARYKVPNRDLIVCTLDSDLPAGVVPFKIAGNWMVSTVDGITRVKGMGFKIHQDKRITLCGFDNFSGYNQTAALEGGIVTAFGWANTFSGISDSAHYLHGLAGFLAEGIIGDSGGMIGAVSLGEAVLVSLFSGSSSGYLIYEGFQSGMNAAIAAADALAGVSTGYTVTIAIDPND